MYIVNTATKVLTPQPHEESVSVLLPVLPFLSPQI